MEVDQGRLMAAGAATPRSRWRSSRSRFARFDGRMAEEGLDGGDVSAAREEVRGAAVAKVRHGARVAMPGLRRTEDNFLCLECAARWRGEESGSVGMGGPWGGFR